MEGKDDKLNKIKLQIEYYLSDENLEKDQFFHDHISKDPEGYLAVEYLLNCNNIKKLAATKDEIIKGIEMSKVVELNSDKSKLRRVGNKKLPELKLLKNKRKASEDEKEDENEEEEEDVDHTILKIWPSKETEIKWKQILEEFKNTNKHLNVVYIRFNKNEGNIGVQRKRNEAINFANKISVQGTDFTVEKCEGDDLINFWKEHGKHFEKCLEEKNKKKGTAKKVDKKKKNNDRLKNEVILGGEKYQDAGKIKGRCRSILNLTKDGDKIADKDHEFLKDLVSKHKNGEAKLKDLSYFTTGKPPDHNTSRCFVIMKIDGSQDDFSVHKCIDNLPRK